MKLKVVNDYRKPVVLEADTIGNLKARIMDYFFFTEDDLSQRLLVPDGRDMLDVDKPFIFNGYDLLALDDGSILDNLDGLEDDATLLIGWKGPFIVSLVPAAYRISRALSAAYDVRVDCYNTVGELKQKLELATGESATEDNLPEILFNADNNNKQLICFGFYRFCNDFRGGDPKFRIYRNKNNKPEIEEMKHSLLLYFLTKDGKRPRVRYFDDDGEEDRCVVTKDNEGRQQFIPLKEFSQFSPDSNNFQQVTKKKTDLRTGRTLGSDCERNGMYYLARSPTTAATTATPSPSTVAAPALSSGG